MSVAASVCFIWHTAAYTSIITPWRDEIVILWGYNVLLTVRYRDGWCVPGRKQEENNIRTLWARRSYKQWWIVCVRKFRELGERGTLWNEAGKTLEQKYDILQTEMLSLFFCLRANDLSCWCHSSYCTSKSTFFVSGFISSENIRRDIWDDIYV